MKKSNIQKQRKRGRPALRDMPKGGVTPIVGLRLPTDLRNRAESWALSNDLKSMSEAYRRLIEIGLEVRKKHR